MVRAIGRWVFPCLALFIIGPVLSRLIGGLRADDGGPDVSLLVSARPALGLVMGLIGVAAALAYGGIAGRLLGERTGTLSGGLLLAWVAWMTGDLSLVLRLEGSAGTLALLAAEGLAVCGLALAGVAVIARLSPDRACEPMGVETKRLAKWPALAGALAGAAAALAVAWLVAFNGLRGQGLMAAVLGSIAAGAISMLAAQSLSGEKPPVLMPFLAVLIAAALGPLVGFVRPGAGELASAMIDGSLPGVLMIQPLDWAAGMLLGVPIGIGWMHALSGSGRESKPAAARSHG